MQLLQMPLLNLCKIDTIWLPSIVQWYTVQCTVYSTYIFIILYSVQCTYRLQFIQTSCISLHSEQCASRILCTLYSTHWCIFFYTHNRMFCVFFMIYHHHMRRGKHNRKKPTLHLTVVLHKYKTLYSEIYTYIYTVRYFWGVTF